MNFIITIEFKLVRDAGSELPMQQFNNIMNVMSLTGFCYPGVCVMRHEDFEGLNSLDYVIIDLNYLLSCKSLYFHQDSRL